MKNLNEKLYAAAAIIGIVLMGWKIIDTKLIYQPPQYTSLSLLPVDETPVWEASDSATFEESEATLSAQLTAQAYMVMDVDSRTVLVEKNAQQPLPPASTTKLMTALAALDLFELNETVQVSTQTAEENDGGGLFPQEVLTVHDLLVGMLVSSANDSAFALAEHAPGGIPGFLERMNLLAARFHLDQTLFGNPTGYDDPPNRTTARDLMVLVLRVLQNPQLVEWMGLESTVVYNREGTIRHFLFTTNELLAKDPEVIAGKTGTTPLAGEVLFTLAEHQGHRIALIVMNSADRYADTQILLNWLRYNISWEYQSDFPQP